MKRGLRGHDGAVQAISFHHASMVHSEARLLDLTIYEGRKWLVWVPPAPPPKPTICDSFTRRVFEFFGLGALTPQGL